ncbi:MAG: hypothetical protein JW993_07300 [Sedimentisphaerales bacterium]|nr:hypothetical protein [Sedimentisphaerales bacterium]
MVLVQVPLRAAPVADGLLGASPASGARLVLLRPDGSTGVLSEGFDSACDPDISFDATRLLFAGKKAPADNWNIYEMALDGTSVRQITRDQGDCRSPGYQSTLYTIKPVGVPSEPEYHLTYVRRQDRLNECGSSRATDLYSCKFDGSASRRLTYNLSGDMDPFLMDDGRLLLASWQRAKLDHGLTGRVALMGVNIDGADYALYAGYEGGRIKRMPCVTQAGLAVFVEADDATWDGAGRLACVQTRRPLHSYRQITNDSDGLFHSPSPLPDGRILVSRRPADGSGTHGVYRVDPATGASELVFDDPEYHDIEAKLVRPRKEPDGRSTAVPEDPESSALTGKFYCLNVYTSDLKPGWLPPGSVQRLRVLEGIPVRDDGRSQPVGTPPLAQRRILGDIPVERDGSFNIEVPANTPVELQILDADGMALRSCGWIWAKDYARQGCIGCHEDPELTPENRFVAAVAKPSIKLTLPAAQRRTVDFRRDVMPIIDAKCAQCHGRANAAPRLGNGDGQPGRSYESLLATGETPEEGRYVHAGRARTSPLIWHLYGRNTSRPWDEPADTRTVRKMPPDGGPALTDDEIQTFVEWIDMGALWDGIPDDMRPLQDSSD